MTQLESIEEFMLRQLSELHGNPDEALRRRDAQHEERLRPLRDAFTALQAAERDRDAWASAMRDTRPAVEIQRPITLALRAVVSAARALFEEDGP